MRKLISVLLVALLLTSLVAGCAAPAPAPQEGTPAPQGGQEPAPLPAVESGGNEDPVTITYLSRWANPADPRSKYYLDMLDEFRALYPYITVEDISIGDDSEAHRAKVNSGVASGSPPDMFITNTTMNNREWVANGVVSDITELVHSDAWTGPSGDMLSKFEYDGLIYGCPNQLSATVCVVNTQIYKDLGLAVPETWEDIEKTVEPLTNAGIVPFGLSAQQLNEVDRFIILIGMRMYGLDFRDKQVTKEWNWTGPELQAVLEKAKYFIDNGFLDPDAVSLTAQSGTIPMFEQGQVAMMLTPSWNISFFQAMDFKDDIRIVNFPYLADNPEYKDIWLVSQGEGFLITPDKGTPEYDACCKLLAFLMSKDAFAGFLEQMQGGVVPTDVEYDMDKADPVMRSYMESFSKRSDVTDNFATYLDSKIQLSVSNQQEMQTLFVGRSPAEVGATLKELYDKELN